MPVSEYAKKEIDSRWLKIVEDIAPDKAEKLRNCRKFVRTGVCEEHHKYLRGSLCRLRDLCPVDGSGYTKEQSEDALEILRTIDRRVGGKHSVTVWAGEFTLPKRAWGMVSDADVKRMKSLGADVINDMFARDKACGERSCKHRKRKDGSCSAPFRYRLGFEVSFHYWHSSDPFFGWFPHLHVNLSDIAFDTVKNEWVKLNFWLYDMRRSGESKLDSCWKKHFESSFGLVGDNRHWNAHWAYRRGTGRVRHRLSYAMRNPVSDCYKALDRLVYRGTTSEKTWFARLLLRPNREKRTQWFGYLGDSVKSKYLKSLNVNLESKAVRRKRRNRRVCPIDGTEITWNRQLDSLSFALTYYKDVPVLAYGKREVATVEWLLKARG